MLPEASQTDDGPTTSRGSSPGVASLTGPIACGPVTSTGRAWGKVILLGEHAVVYGVPALAVGIDLGARASAVRAGDGATSTLAVPGWGVSVSEGDSATDLARAWTAIVGAARQDSRTVLSGGPVALTAHAELPPGGGLGCSAALGVALARSLVPGMTSDEAAGLAMSWERVFHGNPSGIDAAVAAHGGSILYEKGSPMQSVPLKVSLTVCVGSTGIASSTKSMVDGLARLREKKPELVAKAFSGITALVRNARLALEAGDIAALGNLMNLNQMILSGLLLSTEEIERLCGTARDDGALGAKLTGAGGGGCVVALAGDSLTADRIVAGWKLAGFTGFSTKVSPSHEVLP